MWIENVSMSAIQKAHHFDPGPNSLLIQIVDPGFKFPRPKFQFKETAKFQFWDEEDETMKDIITDEIAAEIVTRLFKAFHSKMNVIVHCHAGLCRSGAVAEVGITMGFQDTEVPRIPNLLVKRKLFEQINSRVANVGL